MNRFQTPVEVPPCNWKTGYRQKFVFIGSCFTENMGEKMEKLRFETDINPFGILYNPISIAQCINRLLLEDKFSEKDLFRHDGLWHNYAHHGRFSAGAIELSLQQINNRLETSSGFLKKADVVLITFGSAWVYELKATGQIVANCHKVPDASFRRFRLSVAEIVEQYRNTLETLWEINPSVKIIFTVSPIRHRKDGAIENQLSKSTLLLAVDSLVKGYGPERCAYFPAYEIVMDELRDYRFYAADMVHLSTMAIEVIWEYFRDYLLDDTSLEIMKKINSISKAAEHKPLNMNTPEFETFLKNSLQKTIDLTSEFPYLDLTDFKGYFENMLLDTGDKKLPYQPISGL